MVDQAAPMLQRNPEEVERLNAQSYFLRAFFNGQLIHPSIPRDGLQAIADVGTGTGVWMEEVQQEFAATNIGRNVQFTGFDISGALFPRQKRPGQTFVIHDAVEPFPDKYHEKFDLVHLRFLSYGIKVDQLEDLVEWVSEILRPGGYLQWQEIDTIDAWTIPETSTAKQVIYWLVSERLDRGLTPAVTTPIIKALQSRKVHVENGNINPMCWTDDLLRIYHLETLSTYNHPSAEVNSMKFQWIINFFIPLLQTCASSRAAKAKESRLPWNVVEGFFIEAAKINQLVETMKNGPDPKVGEFEVLITRIVARKAKLFPQDGPWLSEWHGTTADLE
ncbi:hypothetical protein MMC17_000783 [Xylographa soralifera]|nr:hypothetical protein [Xylographa soralifera]